jgi:hypothetical protein
VRFVAPMQKLFKFAQKGVRILVYRFRTQGVRTTLIWLYARGVPKVTGVPMARYSQITRQIYVGAQYGRWGRRWLQRRGINGVINMRVEYDDAARGLTLEHYCHLPTMDDDAPTLEHLYEGVAFIRRVIADKGKIYIHCAGGIGRAPTMVVAYFVCHGFSVDDAIRLIKQGRPFVNIMPAQMKQLRRLETLELERQIGKASDYSGES